MSCVTQTLISQKSNSKGVFADPLCKGWMVLGRVRSNELTVVADAVFVIWSAVRKGARPSGVI